jgi:hypothetical protein
MPLPKAQQAGRSSTSWSLQYSLKCQARGRVNWGVFVLRGHTPTTGVTARGFGIRRLRWLPRSFRGVHPPDQRNGAQLRAPARRLRAREICHGLIALGYGRCETVRPSQLAAASSSPAAAPIQILADLQNIPRSLPTCLSDSAMEGPLPFEPRCPISIL